MSHHHIAMKFKKWLWDSREVRAMQRGFSHVSLPSPCGSDDVLFENHCPKASRNDPDLGDSDVDLPSDVDSHMSLPSDVSDGDFALDLCSSVDHVKRKLSFSGIPNPRPTSDSRIDFFKFFFFNIVTLWTQQCTKQDILCVRERPEK